MRSRLHTHFIYTSCSCGLVSLKIWLVILWSTRCRSLLICSCHVAFTLSLFHSSTKTSLACLPLLFLNYFMFMFTLVQRTSSNWDLDSPLQRENQVWGAVCTPSGLALGCERTGHTWFNFDTLSECCSDIVHLSIIVGQSIIVSFKEKSDDPVAFSVCIVVFIKTWI